MTRPTRRWPEAVGASAGPVRTSARTLENGLSELYVNALARDGGEVSALMRVFTEAGAYDEARFPETSRVKRRLRETEEGREDMGNVIEEIREEIRAECIAECIAEGIETGRAEGRAEGEARGEVRGTLKTLVRLVRDGLVSVQDAAASAGVDADEIRRTLAAGDGTQTSSGGSLRRQSPST